ncbi:hypothetical protein [Streptomyces sp. NPDC101234]
MKIPYAAPASDRFTSFERSGDGRIQSTRTFTRPPYEVHAEYQKLRIAA